MFAASVDVHIGLLQTLQGIGALRGLIFIRCIGGGVSFSPPAGLRLLC